LLPSFLEARASDGSASPAALAVSARFGRDAAIAPGDPLFFGA
jgi:hypothetical protein